MQFTITYIFNLVVECYGIELQCIGMILLFMSIVLTLFKSPNLGLANTCQNNCTGSQNIWIECREAFLTKPQMGKDEWTAFWNSIRGVIKPAMVQGKKGRKRLASNE